MSDNMKFYHPSAVWLHEFIEKMRDSYAGEDAIKAKTVSYLPMTSGQIEDGAGTGQTSGQHEYDAYVLRAYYPEIFKEAIEAAIGIMHRKTPEIKLPKQLEYLLEESTPTGEGLEMVLRAVNTEQLTVGRVGLLGDIVQDGTAHKIRLLQYNAETIVNWASSSDGELSFVILDESAPELQQDFSWKEVTAFRAIAFGSETSFEGATMDLAGQGVVGVSQLEKLSELPTAHFSAPNVRGNTLDKIPFSIINSKDLSLEVDTPPLLGLANLCLAIYRGEADYRQNLFMQGQDTLVRVGRPTGANGDEGAVRVGAGAVLEVPTGGDAKYIGVSSSGLSEQRQSLENDYKRAAQKGMQLVDTGSKAKESGDALKLRMAAQTATLPQIAKAGAAGVEKVLRIMAELVGANPEEVSVSPNLDFTRQEVNTAIFEAMVNAKGSGAPISLESIHTWMQDNGMTKYTLEQELALINSEEPVL